MEISFHQWILFLEVKNLCSLLEQDILFGIANSSDSKDIDSFHPSLSLTKKTSLPSVCV